MRLIEDVARLAAGSRLFHMATARPQRLDQEIAHPRLVVDDEHGGARKVFTVIVARHIGLGDGAGRHYRPSPRRTASLARVVSTV